MSDHGLTVGDGVFEAVKVVGGLPFALDRHLERLHRSAAGSVSRPSTRTPCAGDRCRPGGGRPAAGPGLRVTVTGGPCADGPGRGDAAPTVIVVADVMQPWAPTTAVATVPWPRNERGALAGLKTTSYAENVVALAHALRERRQRGGLRQPGRAPVRGHRLERLLRRGRRAAHPTLASGCLAG